MIFTGLRPKPDVCSDDTLSSRLQLWALVCVWTEKLLTDVRTSTQVAKRNRGVEQIQELLIGPKRGGINAWVAFEFFPRLWLQCSPLWLSVTLDPLGNTEHTGGEKNQVLSTLLIIVKWVLHPPIDDESVCYKKAPVDHPHWSEQVNRFSSNIWVTITKGSTQSSEDTSGLCK